MFSECITCGVCKTTFHNDFYSCSGARSHSQTFNVFALFSLFVYLPFFSSDAHVWSKWFSTFYSEWSSFNGSNFSTEMMRGFFSQKKEKSSQVAKNPCFGLNHLIYSFSIYIILYIYMIYIIFFRRLRSVRLIGLEQRSLSVGKNFGLAKTLSWANVVGPTLVQPSLLSGRKMQAMPAKLAQDLCRSLTW